MVVYQIWEDRGARGLSPTDTVVFTSLETAKGLVEKMSGACYGVAPVWERFADEVLRFGTYEIHTLQLDDSSQLQVDTSNTTGEAEVAAFARMWQALIDSMSPEERSRVREMLYTSVLQSRP